MAAERKTLTQLSVPICLETFFYMLSGMVDTLMLSSVSDQAVGAVGTANTYIGVFIIMFGVISSGMIAVMSQNIGAGRPGIAYQARQLGLIFNALIGIVMSVILATFSGGILRIVSIAPALLEPAEIYLRIVGGACFLNALIPIFSSYLRVFGYTKHSLIGTVVGNVLNIIIYIMVNLKTFRCFLEWGADLFKRVSFRTDYKYAIWEDYVIIYKISKEYVEVYRVVNRYQDITRIFD